VVEDDLTLGAGPTAATERRLGAHNGADQRRRRHLMDAGSSRVGTPFGRPSRCRGDASFLLNLPGAIPGYRVSVFVEVYKNGHCRSCGNSFTEPDSTRPATSTLSVHRGFALQLRHAVMSADSHHTYPASLGGVDPLRSLGGYAYVRATNSCRRVSSDALWWLVTLSPADVPTTRVSPFPADPARTSISAVSPGRRVFRRPLLSGTSTRAGAAPWSVSPVS
jgi:hypothetical protein